MAEQRTLPKRTRLGTVTQARDALGLRDVAEVWEWVHAERLYATRRGAEPWIVWKIEREDDAT